MSRPDEAWMAHLLHEYPKDPKGGYVCQHCWDYAGPSTVELLCPVRVRDERQTMLAMLKKHQWGPSSPIYGESQCPECYGLIPDHGEDCKWEAVLGGGS